MSYIPAIPLGGIAGLRFLERTGDVQREAHARSPEIQRDIAYFAENIGNVKTAEDLISDRRLARVALGAFGLGDDVDKRAFVKKILEGGTTDESALANRLTDQRYRDITDAFRFDRESGPRTGLSSLRDDIISKYLDQSFEISVGEQDSSLRLALDFKRRINEVAERGWFAILGDRPAREVFQTALGLPSETGSLDIDKQKELFEERAEKLLGSEGLAALNDPAVLDKVVSRYLVLDDALRGPNVNTPGFTALTLLSSAASGFGPSASFSLFQSSF